MRHYLIHPERSHETKAESAAYEREGKGKQREQSVAFAL